MLTPYRTIVERHLHKNVIWTSLVLPRKVFDPNQKVQAPFATFIVEVEGVTYYRDFEGEWKFWDSWAPSVKWILEGGKTTRPLGQSAFTETHWVKWTDISDVWQLKAEETQRVEKRKHDMKQAAITGAKLALANQAGDVAVNVIVSTVPAVEPFMQNPAARALAKIVGALVLSHSADVVAREHADLIRSSCELIITAATMELTQGQLERLQPAIQELVALSKKVA